MERESVETSDCAWGKMGRNNDDAEKKRIEREGERKREKATVEI